MEGDRPARKRAGMTRLPREPSFPSSGAAIDGARRFPSEDQAVTFADGLEGIVRRPLRDRSKSEMHPPRYLRAAFAFRGDAGAEAGPLAS